MIFKCLTLYLQINSSTWQSKMTKNTLTGIRHRIIESLTTFQQQWSHFFTETAEVHMLFTQVEEMIQLLYSTKSKKGHDLKCIQSKIVPLMDVSSRHFWSNALKLKSLLKKYEEWKERIFALKLRVKVKSCRQSKDRKVFVLPPLQWSHLLCPKLPTKLQNKLWWNPKDNKKLVNRHKHQHSST